MGWWKGSSGLEQKAAPAGAKVVQAPRERKAHSCTIFVHRASSVNKNYQDFFCTCPCKSDVYFALRHLHLDLDASQVFSHICGLWTVKALRWGGVQAHFSLGGGLLSNVPSAEDKE